MASNKQLGVIDVECGKDIFQFKSDFSFLAALNDLDADPQMTYISLANGLTDPKLIKTVMLTALKTKNGDPVKKPSDEMELLITRYGLQECWLLARHLLAYAMVGDEKKSKLVKMKPNKLTSLLTEPFLLESSKNRRLLWVYHLAISGICVCISFSLFMLLFAPKIT